MRCNVDQICGFAECTLGIAFNERHNLLNARHRLLDISETLQDRRRERQQTVDEPFSKMPHGAPVNQLSEIFEQPRGFAEHTIKLFRLFGNRPQFVHGIAETDTVGD